MFPEDVMLGSFVDHQRQYFSVRKLPESQSFEIYKEKINAKWNDRIFFLCYFLKYHLFFRDNSEVKSAMDCKILCFFMKATHLLNAVASKIVFFLLIALQLSWKMFDFVYCTCALVYINIECLEIKILSLGLTVK